MEDDFLAGYFNAVLLFGHSLKKFVVSQSPVSPLSLINEFRNTTFEGKKKVQSCAGFTKLMRGKKFDFKHS